MVIFGVAGKKRAGKDTVYSALKEKYSFVVRVAFADALKCEVASYLAECKNWEELYNFIISINVPDDPDAFEIEADPDSLAIAKAAFRDTNPTGLRKFLVKLGIPQYRKLNKMIPEDIMELFDSPETKSNFRPLLQWWGTDYRRTWNGESYWTDRLLEEIKHLTHHYDYQCTICITDVRFPDELEFVEKLKGIKILVEDPNNDASDLHISERALDSYKDKFDIVFTNDKTKLSIEDFKAEVIKRTEKYCIPKKLKLKTTALIKKRKSNSN